MSTANFTSGPWAIDPASDEETTAIYRPDGDEHICLIHHDRETGPTECELANAHLIAAAPDLLAACKAAVEATGGSANWKGETHYFLSLCEAAISKATEAQP